MRQIDETQYNGWRRRLSLALLVIVNLLPIYGVVALNWDVGSLVILYWSENLVIGFYALLKMLINSPIIGLFSGLFFLIHYGGFCAVHGLFILKMLIDPDVQFLQGDSWPIFFVFIQLLVDVVSQVIALAPPAWLIAFAGLMISHGASFIMNYLLAEERNRVNSRNLMSSPYSRIVIMHITVIIGSFVAMSMGQPIGMLLVLVCLKMAVDIGLHLREHVKLTKNNQA